MYMFGSLSSLIIGGIVFGPLIVFFAVTHRWKAPVEPLSEDLRLFHEIKAKRYFHWSLAIGLLMIIMTAVALFLLVKYWRPSIGLVLFGVPTSGLVGVIICLTLAGLGIKHCKLAGISTRKIFFQNAVAVLGYLGFLSNIAMGVLAMAGMGWGRPLRVNGKVIKPMLSEGKAWAQGETPDIANLNEATKKALEALWLHDAKKEYASVPAFSRLGWQLAALAAPPELLRDVHIAAIQEIEHAKKCFALAAGFSGSAQSVLPMPEMLNEQPCHRVDKLILNIAKDSLSDGCLLEGFNADIALRSTEICKDIASLKVIKQIAREERSHEELSWRILEFCYQLDPTNVGYTLEKEMSRLSKLPRPTASSSQNLPIVKAADAQALIDYGRLPDTEFDVIWETRMSYTKDRLSSLLESNKEIDIKEIILKANANLTSSQHGV